MQASVDASLIPASALVPIARWSKRLIAFGMIFISFLGSYVMLNGWRWEWPTTNTTIQAFILAVLYQLVFTGLQFAFRDNWQSIWYALALGGSVVPSVLAYGAIIHAGWANWFARALPDGPANFAAWLLLAIVLTAIDAIPERILVRRAPQMRR